MVSFLRSSWALQMLVHEWWCVIESHARQGFSCVWIWIVKLLKKSSEPHWRAARSCLLGPFDYRNWARTTALIPLSSSPRSRRTSSRYGECTPVPHTQLYSCLTTGGGASHHYDRAVRNILITTDACAPLTHRGSATPSLSVINVYEYRSGYLIVFRNPLAYNSPQWYFSSVWCPLISCYE